MRVEVLGDAPSGGLWREDREGATWLVSVLGWKEHGRGRLGTSGQVKELSVSNVRVTRSKG